MSVKRRATHGVARNIEPQQQRLPNDRHGASATTDFFVAGPVTLVNTSYSRFDHDRRLPERGFLRDGTPYRNLAGILARLKIGQGNTEAQRNRS
jgi:hypothetical protein